MEVVVVDGEEEEEVVVVVVVMDDIPSLHIFISFITLSLLFFSSLTTAAILL